MPYKSGKMKGQLTTTEIRKLIKAHNTLVSIKIPKGSKRDDIIKIIENNGYEVNHEKKALIPKVEMKRKPKVNMKTAEKVLPKPKTKEEKEKLKKVREEKKKEKDDKIKKEGIKQGAAIQRVLSKRMDRKKTLKEKNINNNIDKMTTYKIGDTYLFKVGTLKQAEFKGIAEKINDKSVTMVFKWVNDKTIKKPIKKEDIIKRLGGTNYDEDLEERYKGVR